MARLLIVEDHEPVLDLLALNLKASGHEVLACRDGDAALRHFHRGGFQCVILDLMLPGVDGYALLAERRRLGLAAAARIIVLTARADDHSHVRGLELGCDAYVTKPFVIDDLMAIVDRVLAASPSELTSARLAQLRRSQTLTQLDQLLHRARDLDRLP